MNGPIEPMHYMAALGREMMEDCVSPSAATYAERTTPMLVSPDLENQSGALFNRKGDAILHSPKLTDEYLKRFIAASEALLERARSSIQ